MKFEGPRMTRAFVFLGEGNGMAAQSLSVTRRRIERLVSFGLAVAVLCCCVALDLHDQTYMMGSAGGEPARSSQDDLPGDADGLEEGAIVADDQQGAVIGA